jgi:hypothetical protein
MPASPKRKQRVRQSVRVVPVAADPEREERLLRALDALLSELAKREVLMLTKKGVTDESARQ